MSLRTVGLGAFALVVSVAWLQLNCTSDSRSSGGTGGTGGAGGFKNQSTGGTMAIGGTTGIGGQVGTGRCLDGPSGEGGHECVAPLIVVVDAETGGAICDATFSVNLGDGGTLCDPSEGSMATDGGASCTYLFDRIINFEPPVTVQVSAPGYQAALFSLSSGCVPRGMTMTTVPLVPIGDAGLRARDASSDLGTICTVDDSGGGGDCLIRGLHRYVCPASAPIQAPGCSSTGEDNFDGTTTRCCP